MTLWSPDVFAVTITDTEAKVAAIITGLAGIIAAVAGILLALRKIRTQEQKAAKKQLDEVEGYLAEEREERIEIERRLHQANVLLAQHGIERPRKTNP